MSNSGHLWPHLASRADIIIWADRMEARSEFPRLIRRLILRNNDQLAELDMRAAEGVGVPGYDGITQASRSTPFVPKGTAVWELGVGDDYRSKANDDYRNRTDNPLGRDPQETTFVFVTPRQFNDKQNWVADKKAEGIWADVRVLDVDDIDQALESAPAVHTWFSEMLGKPAHGSQTIEDWWESFRTLSSPPLDPEMVLAGRPDAAAELLRLFETESRLTVISATSVDDLLAFVAAAILSTTPSRRDDLLSRCLIVRDSYTLRSLASTEGLLILIPFEDELRREARLIRTHHILIRSEDGGVPDIELPSVDQPRFVELLVDRGETTGRAEELARSARRSIVEYQRRAASPGTMQAPPWANSLDSLVTRRGWLAGRWNELRTGDTDALSLLFDSSYSDAREKLQPLAVGPDPLFVIVGDTWAVSSLEEAWQYGHGKLQQSDLNALEVLIQSVLGTVDPSLELPVDERWLSQIYGRTRIHSHDLREGVAQVLALIGARADSVAIGSATVESWLRHVIWQIFNRANCDETGRAWASLTDVMPLLAEAMPEVFLSAVQKGLEADKPLLGFMFADHDDNSFSSNSPHTGLLWALENTAWSARHFSLTVDLLAQLSKEDPGGRLSNRPAASLASIFRSWSPQTAVGLEHRLLTLDGIRDRHPQVAWDLMMSMLPQFQSVGMPNHQPKFRNWKPQETATVSPDTLESFAAAATLLVDDSEEDADRWRDLIERFDDLPDAAFNTAVERLGPIIESNEDGLFKAKLWEPLRNLVHKHQRYANADWSMSPERIDRLGPLLQHLTPSNSVERFRWLFDEELPDLPELMDEEFDVDRARAATEVRRSDAISKLIDDAGINNVLELARAASHPRLVGIALADNGDELVGRELLEYIDSGDKHLHLAAFAWAIKRRQGDQMWTTDALRSFENRPKASARILLASDDLQFAWSYAGDNPAINKCYWSEFVPYGRGPDFEFAETASRCLLEHDRPRAALMLMNLYAASTNIDRELVVEALETLVETPLEHADQTRVDSHEIERLLDYLRDGDGDVEEARLGLLEWRLLPALDYHAHSPILERRLAREPAFFVEVLSMTYRPRNSEPEQEVPPQAASNAYRLLNDWKLVPGSDDDNALIDATKLRDWLDEALNLLREADRLEIGLNQIGKILAKSPSDDDGSWPSLPVRENIERIARSELDDGLRMQIYNSRGVTSRGLMDGGTQEREQVTHYESMAETIGAQWPRTSAILRDVSESYRSDAARHDAQTERFTEGLD